MQVKIDTKEKFHVITILEQQVTANMTDKLQETLQETTNSGVKNLIINLAAVESMEEAAAEKWCAMQQNAYESNHSFVFCCLNKALEAWLDEKELLEIMNVTPTESEAMDIVQMEEIEREMFND